MDGYKQIVNKARWDGSFSKKRLCRFATYEERSAGAALLSGSPVVCRAPSCDGREARRYPISCLCWRSLPTRGMATVVIATAVKSPVAKRTRAEPKTRAKE